MVDRAYQFVGIVEAGQAAGFGNHFAKGKTGGAQHIAGGGQPLPNIFAGKAGVACRLVVGDGVVEHLVIGVAARGGVDQSIAWQRRQRQLLTPEIEPVETVGRDIASHPRRADFRWLLLRAGRGGRVRCIVAAAASGQQQGGAGRDGKDLEITLRPEHENPPT
ncbi:hypothetical protein ACFS07_01035 [Undibacterium arcticum]